MVDPWIMEGRVSCFVGHVQGIENNKSLKIDKPDKQAGPVKVNRRPCKKY
ncbi:hypothetical protein APE01nite_21610 [Acetobacter peroxydans]|uniref:Uncharacterized protein n=1 Tax=Acetobacter peroxydans TaxID=104098 RepID=A0A4Y3TX72_9PROT|nr:hypothetical protein APE01nite_21610 [Acetobacter peroxydans]